MIFFVCKCERLFFFGVFKQFCGFWLWLKNRYLCFLRVDYFVFQVNVGRQSSHMVELLVCEDSVHGSWPWQVGLYNGDDIKPDWVLTASHCISWFIKPSDYRIRLGDWYRFYVDAYGTEQVRNVSKIITHPNYHRPVLVNNDVALIKLDRPVVLNSHVNTVCLPKMGEQVSSNSTCFITGKKSTFKMVN